MHGKGPSTLRLVQQTEGLPARPPAGLGRSGERRAGASAEQLACAADVSRGASTSSTGGSPTRATCASRGAASAAATTLTVVRAADFCNGRARRFAEYRERDLVVVVVVVGCEGRGGGKGGPACG